jgi:hypothetical protein
MTPEEQDHAELQHQITHPIQEYDEARVEKLLAQVQQATRFSWPASFTFNV